MTDLSQNHQTFQRVCQADVLLVFQFGTLSKPEQHWRALRLPASNRLRSTCLADNVDSLADANVDLQRLEVFVESDEESWVHGGYKEV